MSNQLPKCRRITVHAFRGDRSKTFWKKFQEAMDDEQRGLGPGPTPEDCLLYAGHAGLSTDSAPNAIFGFHPYGGQLSAAAVLNGLKAGNAFPGQVRIDTPIFAAAVQAGLPVLTFTVVFPDPEFNVFDSSLSIEKQGSRYTYSFPNGDGDCNCITWMERLGLPLLTGRMNEFIPGIVLSSLPVRRFGNCM